MNEDFVDDKCSNGGKRYHSTHVFNLLSFRKNISVDPLKV